MIIKRKNKEILEEKEFGIPSDIFYSGFKKTYKKWFGKLRKELAKYLYNGIDDIRREITNIEVEIKDNLPKLDNDELTKKLLDYIYSLNINLSILEIDKSNPRNRFNAATNTLLIRDDADAISIAHELGHAITANFSIDSEIRENAEKNNTYARNVFKTTESKYNILGNSINMTPTDRAKLIKRGQLYNNVSTKEAFNKLLESGTISDIVILEETNASNIAMDLLKRFGATNDELRIARKRYDLALETYKLKADKIASMLRVNLVNIKSRRTKI
jgi:hypothetical protein